MIDAVNVFLAPGTMKRVRFEAAWRQETIHETIETLVIEGLRARDQKEVSAGHVN